VGPLPRAGGSQSTHRQAGGASGEVCRGPGCGDRPPGPLCRRWCSAGSGPLVGGGKPGRVGRSVVELFRGVAPRGAQRCSGRNRGSRHRSIPSTSDTARRATLSPLRTTDSTKDHQPPCGAPRAEDRGTRTRPQRVCCGAPRNNCEQANARPERSATGQVRQCRHFARRGPHDQHLVVVLQVDRAGRASGGSVVTKKSHPSRHAGAQPLTLSNTCAVCPLIIFAPTIGNSSSMALPLRPLPCRVRVTSSVLPALPLGAGLIR
jgi:hypothetical protein